MTDTKCADVIHRHYQSREDYIADLFAVIDDEPATIEGEEVDEERAYDILQTELPLSVELVTRVKITFGTGGPADWCEAPVSKHERFGWELAGDVEYHYADWYDHAERGVSDDAAMARYVGMMIEGME